MAMLRQPSNVEPPRANPKPLNALLCRDFETLVLLLLPAQPCRQHRSVSWRSYCPSSGPGGAVSLRCRRSSWRCCANHPTSSRPELSPSPQKPLNSLHTHTRTNVGRGGGPVSLRCRYSPWRSCANHPLPSRPELTLSPKTLNARHTHTGTGHGGPVSLRCRRSPWRCCANHDTFEPPRANPLAPKTSHRPPHAHQNEPWKGSTSTTADYTHQSESIARAVRLSRF